MLCWATPSFMFLKFTDSYGDHAESEELEELILALIHIDSQATPIIGLALVVIVDVYLLVRWRLPQPEPLVRLTVDRPWRLPRRSTPSLSVFLLLTFPHTLIVESSQLAGAVICSMMKISRSLKMWIALLRRVRERYLESSTIYFLSRRCIRAVPLRSSGQRGAAVSTSHIYLHVHY